jgi:hypothetical protein
MEDDAIHKLVADHDPRADICYTASIKGYVPKCECGWVGHLVRVTAVTGLTGARLAAYNAAAEHADTAK